MSTPRNRPAPRRDTAAFASGVRVETEILDALMNLVGELVLARNQVLQFKSQVKDPAFHATTNRLNLITSELQEKLMQSRMQPIGSIWNAIPDMVSELADSLGKRVQVDLSGGDTELDRSLLEAIRDPLLHLLKNAVEHGIETGEQRQSRGKGSEGRISLRAFHEAGLVNLEIADDGGGIACDRVRAKAVQAGLIRPEEAAALSDDESVNLVFRAGFSGTAAGAGSVGMDVVKTHVERLGGTVDLKSRPGLGTTLRIHIPLTLAIIPALMVECAGEILALPQSSLVELVRLDSGGSATGDVSGIEFIHGTPVFRLRGQLLPVVDLQLALGLRDGSPARTVENLVILETDGQTFGLMVDCIHDTEEIVVKPLGPLFQNVAAYAGATILGTGRVALILDVHGLALDAGLIGHHQEAAVATGTRTAVEAENAGRELLIFEPSPGRRMAIPLSAVARLEEFPESAVEHAGAIQVIRYRGSILPLVQAPGRFGNPASGGGESRASMQVIVVQCDGRSAGLVVEAVRDVVRDSGSAERGRTGIDGTESVVLQDLVTDLIDVDAILRDVAPGGTPHGSGSSRSIQPALETSHE